VIDFTAAQEKVMNNKPDSVTQAEKALNRNFLDVEGAVDEMEEGVKRWEKNSRIIVTEDVLEPILSDYYARELKSMTSMGYPVWINGQLVIEKLKQGPIEVEVTRKDSVGKQNGRSCTR